jgi:Tol biopolymer transport system component
MRNIALALLLAVACFAQKRAITHEDVWLMKRTGEPVVSPDGRSVVVSVIEPDYDAAKQSSDLWLVPADGHEAAKQLTFTKAAESGPVWSPDATRLAFVTRRRRR